MMELGSPVAWTTLCNLFYVFFILMAHILVCVSYMPIVTMIYFKHAFGYMYSEVVFFNFFNYVIILREPNIC